MHIEIDVIERPEPRSKLTTDDVANILEAKYGLFSNFTEMYTGDIAEILAESISATTENLFKRTFRQIFGGEKPDPYAKGLQEIEDLFKEYLDNEWLTGVVAGVPTKDALRGYHRMLGKAGRYTGVRRPSFVDTATLRNSIKAKIVE